MHKQLLSTVLSVCLCGGSITLAIDKPGAPPTVKDTGDDAGRRIAAETAAVIKALGASPTAKQISAIVFKAVRSSPASVLAIVAAAVRVSPQQAATEIVTAATAGVPNPWKKVIYRRLAELEGRGSDRDRSSGPDGQRNTGSAGIQTASNRGSNTQGPSGPGTGTDSANGLEMTLAEAIIRTAFDADPRLAFRELQDAVNAALRMDPETLIRNIQSPSAASAVGDAGLSNYANEPLLTPKQPAVSR
jgi:hypothetical protein